MTNIHNPFIQSLNGQKMSAPPLWFMRQAGRHLPEYKALRAQAPNFLTFCLTPEMAAEATLQPLMRYDVDAAILFADILLIPWALGQKLDFLEKQGPVFEAFDLQKFNENSMHTKSIKEKLSPVYETISRVKNKLPSHKSLIGFCGGPWTVFTYMLEGKGTPNKVRARAFAYENPNFTPLMNTLADISADYLIAQAKAGADALQIFESWAENLSPALFEKCVLAPNTRMIKRIRQAGIVQKIIGFPRGAGFNTIKYAHKTGINVLGLGTDVCLKTIDSFLPAKMPVQGNLDPQLLVLGGKVLDEGVKRLLDEGRSLNRAHIFNLGHGVSPDVQIKNVERTISLIKNYNK